MPSFPRDNPVLPSTVTGITTPGAFQLTSNSGAKNTRASIAAGRSWSETYNMLRADDPTVRNFLAFVRRAWNRGIVFDIKHLQTPGSGISPNGTGTSGVTVNGGGQTGDSITTTGWPVSTNNVARAGDLISIPSFGPTLEVYEDANSDASGNATLKINPTIYGSGTTNGESVTTTDVTISAVLSTKPSIPDTTSAFYYSGITLNFSEVPNA